MSRLDRVSVVVPVYGVEQYIKQCIDSLLCQTYPDIEVIVVNDGSPDMSSKIAHQIAALDSRILVVDQTNMGVSAARNEGMRRATGKYMCFVDGDDWVAPDFIEHMVRLAESSGAEVVISTRTIQGSRVGDPQPDSEAESVSNWSAQEATVELLYPKVTIGAWNKLFRTDFLRNNDLWFPTEFAMGEGLYFITRAAQLSSVVVATDHQAYFYRRDNATSATTTLSVHKMVTAMNAIRRIREDLALNTPAVRSAIEFHLAMTSFLALRALRADDRVDQARVLRAECLTEIRQLSLRSIIGAPLSPARKARAAAIRVAPLALASIANRRLGTR